MYCMKRPAALSSAAIAMPPSSSTVLDVPRRRATDST